MADRREYDYDDMMDHYVWYGPSERSIEVEESTKPQEVKGEYRGYSLSIRDLSMAIGRRDGWWNWVGEWSHVLNAENMGMGPEWWLRNGAVEVGEIASRARGDDLRAGVGRAMNKLVKETADAFIRMSGIGIVKRRDGKIRKWGDTTQREKMIVKRVVMVNEFIQEDDQRRPEEISGDARARVEARIIGTLSEGDYYWVKSVYGTLAIGWVVGRNVPSESERSRIRQGCAFRKLEENGEFVAMDIGPYPGVGWGYTAELQSRDVRGRFGWEGTGGKWEWDEDAVGTPMGTSLDETGWIFLATKIYKWKREMSGCNRELLGRIDQGVGHPWWRTIGTLGIILEVLDDGKSERVKKMGEMIKDLEECWELRTYEEGTGALIGMQRVHSRWEELVEEMEGLENKMVMMVVLALYKQLEQRRRYIRLENSKRGNIPVLDIKDGRGRVMIGNGWELPEIKRCTFPEPWIAKIKAGRDTWRRGRGIGYELRKKLYDQIWEMWEGREYREMVEMLLSLGSFTKEKRECWRMVGIDQESLLSLCYLVGWEKIEIMGKSLYGSGGLYTWGNKSRVEELSRGGYRIVNEGETVPEGVGPILVDMMGVEDFKELMEGTTGDKEIVEEIRKWWCGIVELARWRVGWKRWKRMDLGMKFYWACREMLSWKESIESMGGLTNRRRVMDMWKDYVWEIWKRWNTEAMSYLVGETQSKGAISMDLQGDLVRLIRTRVDTGMGMERIGEVGSGKVYGEGAGEGWVLRSAVCARPITGRVLGETTEGVVEMSGELGAISLRENIGYTAKWIRWGALREGLKGKQMWLYAKGGGDRCVVVVPDWEWDDMTWFLGRGVGFVPDVLYLGGKEKGMTGMQVLPFPYENGYDGHFCTGVLRMPDGSSGNDATYTMMSRAWARCNGWVGMESGRCGVVGVGFEKGFLRRIRREIEKRETGKEWNKEAFMGTVCWANTRQGVRIEYIKMDGERKVVRMVPRYGVETEGGVPRWMWVGKEDIPGEDKIGEYSKVKINEVMQVLMGMCDSGNLIESPYVGVMRVQGCVGGEAWERKEGMLVVNLGKKMRVVDVWYHSFRKRGVNLLDDEQLTTGGPSSGTGRRIRRDGRVPGAISEWIGIKGIREIGCGGKKVRILEKAREEFQPSL